MSNLSEYHRPASAWAVETFSLKPKKSDISDVRVMLLWEAEVAINR